ncbi:MAG: TonB-dependent receptor [Burkholderiales bacterium]
MPALGDLEGVLAQPVYGDGRSAGASKHPQDVESAPAAVVVRTGGEIRAQGYRTLAEVLESMPGIHLQYDRAYVYGGVRGINRPGDFNSRVLVMIDGARINDALYEGGPLGREFPLDVGLIDRVEYVPGPGSALYGSSAVLGVVNVITRTPSQLPGFRSTVELGTNANRKLSTTWGGELAGGRMLLGYSSERRPGRDLYFPEFDAPSTNFGVAQRADGERANKLFAKARWAEFTVTGGVSERVKEIPTASYDAVFNTPNPWTDRYAFLNVDFARRWDGDQELHARLGAERYQFRERTTTASVDGASDGKEADDADAVSGELRYSWLRWAGHRLTVGVEFQHNLRQSIRSETLSPQPRVQTDFNISSDRHAVFVADEWQLTPSVLLNIGARADRRIDGQTTTSPRLAAIWTPDPAWTLKWTQGSAFREANAFERFYFDDTQKVNPGLKPEALHSHELLAIWRPAPDLTLEASAYSFRIADLVELMTDEDGLNVFRNRGELRSRGIDLVATWVMAGGGQLRISGSHQLATDQSTGARLSGAPSTLAKLAWTLPGPVAGSTLGLNAQYVSSRLTRSNARIGGYFHANAHLSYAPPGKPWSVALGVYNLGDEHHLDPAGPELRQDAIRQDGREIRLQLGWAF